MDDKKIIVTEIIEKNVKAPLNFPSELIFILWKGKDLLNVYFQFVMLSRMGIPMSITQPELAKVFNLTYALYLRKRKELEELNLIKVEIINNNLTRIVIDDDILWGLLKIERGSIENRKTPQLIRKASDISNYLNHTGEFYIKALKEKSLPNGQIGISDNIYNIYPSSKSNNIYNNKTNTNKTNANDKYPKEDYTIVINAFKKYKGVGLIGPEVSYHMRAIKMMFQANHTPKQITDFMKWLHDNESNQETSWVKTWTIWTVQKKMPEFLGGKLKVKTMEEDYPKYGNE